MELKMSSALDMIKKAQSQFGQNVKRPESGGFGAGIPQTVQQAPAGEMPPNNTPTPEEEQAATEMKRKTNSLNLNSPIQDLVDARNKLDNWIQIQQKQDNAKSNMGFFNGNNIGGGSATGTQPRGPQQAPAIPQNPGVPTGYGAGKAVGEGVRNFGRGVKNIGRGIGRGFRNMVNAPGAFMQGLGRGYSQASTITASDSSAMKTILGK